MRETKNEKNKNLIHDWNMTHLITISVYLIL